MSGQLHPLASFLRGKTPRYQLNRRLGGPTAGLEVLEGKEKSVASTRNP